MSQPVSQAISPLRQRMLEDMTILGLRADTQRNYIRFVRSFVAFLKRPPDTATPEDIRRFQVHQAESGVQPQSHQLLCVGAAFLLHGNARSA